MNLKHSKLIIFEMILFIFQSVFKLLSILILSLIGMILIPIFLLRTEPFDTINPLAKTLPNGEKNRRFKDKWFDSIWGNEDDGIYGDINYWNKHFHKPSFLSAYIWTAIRNPVHNFTKRIGVNTTIVRYDVYRFGSLIYSKAYGVNNKVYPMIRFKKTWESGKWTDIYIGYKNFNVNKVPKHYTYQFSMKFNFLRGF